MLLNLAITVMREMLPPRMNTVKGTRLVKYKATSRSLSSLIKYPVLFVEAFVWLLLLKLAILLSVPTISNVIL